MPDPTVLIDNGDLEIFSIESQTLPADRQSFLDCQRIVRNLSRSYAYLEVGSHVGGTLIPYILDERCALAISIDPRPTSQPDERGRPFDYEGNSTARMVQTLAGHATSAQLSKLRTFDMTAAAFSERGRRQLGLDIRPSMVLIDAEHTNRAVFRDFLSVYPCVAPDAIVTFHDSNLIFDALSNIEAFLDHAQVTYRAFFLPEVVYALAFGAAIEPAEKAFASRAFEPDGFIRDARRFLYGEIVANAEHWRA